MATCLWILDSLSQRFHINILQLQRVAMQAILQNEQHPQDPGFLMFLDVSWVIPQNPTQNPTRNNQSLSFWRDMKGAWTSDKWRSATALKVGNQVTICNHSNTTSWTSCVCGPPQILQENCLLQHAASCSNVIVFVSAMCKSTCEPKDRLWGGLHCVFTK